jgi:hypothetical protein
MCSSAAKGWLFCGLAAQSHGWTGIAEARNKSWWVSNLVPKCPMNPDGEQEPGGSAISGSSVGALTNLIDPEGTVL